MPGQFRQGRVWMAFDIAGRIEGVQAVYADEQHMLNMTGVRRRARRHTGQQAECKPF